MAGVNLDLKQCPLALENISRAWVQPVYHLAGFMGIPYQMHKTLPTPIAAAPNKSP